MIGAVVRTALRLDLWFEEKLGRTYHIVMGIGLVSEIIHGVKEFDTRLGIGGNLMRTLVPVLVSALLLVHQVGSLSHLGKRRHGAAL